MKWLQVPLFVPDLVISGPYISLVLPENSVKLSRDLYTGALFIPDIFLSGRTAITVSARET